MGRISLKEQYDNKDVIQQIYLLRDNFEGLETETNEAIQAAKDAAATVGQYTERINRAETTATEAKSTADEAKVLAQGANDNISEASTKADTAISKATNAQSTADTANTTAGNALSKAETNATNITAMQANVNTCMSDIATLKTSKQKALVGSSVQLPNSGWNTSSKTQTVSVSGVTATSLLWIGPDGGSWTEYGTCGVRATAQGEGTVTFQCDTIPTGILTANIIIA